MDAPNISFLSFLFPTIHPIHHLTSTGGAPLLLPLLPHGAPHALPGALQAGADHQGAAALPGVCHVTVWVCMYMTRCVGGCPCVPRTPFYFGREATNRIIASHDQPNKTRTDRPTNPTDQPNKNISRTSWKGPSRPSTRSRRRTWSSTTRPSAPTPACNTRCVPACLRTRWAWQTAAEHAALLLCCLGKWAGTMHACWAWQWKVKNTHVRMRMATRSPPPANPHPQHTPPRQLINYQSLQATDRRDLPSRLPICEKSLQLLRDALACFAPPTVHTVLVCLSVCLSVCMSV